MSSLTQVKEAIPWVCCASGNVCSLFSPFSPKTCSTPQSINVKQQKKLILHRDYLKRKRRRSKKRPLLTRLAGRRRNEVNVVAQKRLLKPLPKNNFGRSENQGEAMSIVSTW